MSANNLSLIWAMTLFQPEDPTTAVFRPTSPTPETDASSLVSVRSATTKSMLQTTILSTILESYAAGKLDLSIN